MEVTSRFLDVARRAIGIEHAMTSDHCFRMQGLDFVERAEPLTASLSVALREIKVRVVVDGVSRHDQTDGMRVQPR